MVERNRIQNIDEIGPLVDIFGSAIRAPTNPIQISNAFKSKRGINYSNKTILNHIDYYAEAFLIPKADRYDIKGRKYVGANLKYYFSDIGFGIGNDEGFVIMSMKYFLLNVDSLEFWYGQEIRQRPSCHET